MRATSISIERAKSHQLFYFVVNVLVYRESDGRCLILKRSEDEIAHPGKYATPGGKLDWSDLDMEHPTRLNGDVVDFQDAIEKLAKREVREEAGVEIGNEFVYINSMAFVRPDSVPVVMVKLAAKYTDGEVQLEAGAFTDFAWVNAEEVKQYVCIDGTAEEVAKAIDIFGIKQPA